MTKPRAVIHADGRIGFPDVLVYEIEAGPRAGERSDVPPTIETHRNPELEPPSTYPCLVIVRDPAQHKSLEQAGFWSSEEHCGRHRGVILDKRAAPGA